MDRDGDQAAIRARQQAAVARLGQHALAGDELLVLLDEATGAVAREMDADYSKVLELLPGSDRLVMRAGVGWDDNLVGSVVEGGTDSQAGFTLLSSEPVILEDASSETRFRLASLHKSHRITSGITVVIPGRSTPFGILGAYTSERRSFSRDDINFLQSVANVLAAAIDRKRSDDERDRLLEDMKVLAETAQMRAAELQGVLDNMLDGVFVADQKRRALLVNRAGARMLGLQDVPAAAELQPLLRIHRPNGQQFGDEHPLLRALAGEAVTMVEAVVTDPDPDLDVDTSLRINAAPIRDQAGHVVAAVAVTRDVSAMVELDRVKEQFISMAAHELKTPVAVMKGYAQALLKMGDTIPPSGRKMLNAIDRGSDRIDRIIKDLLDISRFHAGGMDLTMEPVDLCSLAARVVDKLTPAAPKHSLVLCPSEDVTVLADRARLGQVFTNLMDNAIKYSPSGGEVEVRIERAGNEAIVSVSDQGIGIPRDKQERVFERFFRAHAGTPYDFGGMGVGLHISREIVAKLGGRLWFESDNATGSTFHLSLPVAGRDGVEG